MKLVCCQVCVSLQASDVVKDGDGGKMLHSQMDYIYRRVAISTHVRPPFIDRIQYLDGVAQYSDYRGYNSYFRISSDSACKT